MRDLIFIAGHGFDAVHLGFLSAVFVSLLLVFRTRAKAREAALESLAALSAEMRENAHLAERLGQREQELATQRAVAEAAREGLAAAQARHAEDERRFADLAQGVMQRTSQQFLQLANETFQRHKEGARNDLEKLVTPIGETFAEFRQRVEAIERVRTEDKSALQVQIAAIADNLRQNAAVTGKLVNALSAPRGGGSWGEESLRNVMELAGMSVYADFVEQNHDETERGRLRPDVIIRMPGGREIVVDAKVSVDDFLKAAGESDPALHRAHLAAHARKLRDHVRRLAAKEYWRDFEDRVDFVAMYVPGEQFYAGALEVDRGLFDFAARSKVLIVTPSTLIALAKAVAYGWRQEEAARNAREAAELGRQLYDALTAMGSHVERLGKSLNGSVSAYNSFIGSLERNVLPKARRFEDLRISQAGAREIGSPSEITERLRLPDREGELDFGTEPGALDAAE